MVACFAFKYGNFIRKCSNSFVKYDCKLLKLSRSNYRASHIIRRNFIACFRLCLSKNSVIKSHIKTVSVIPNFLSFESGYIRKMGEGKPEVPNGSADDSEPVKTAKQLKAEAKKLAKMEKFAKKQEQQNAKKDQQQQKV